MPRDSQSYCNTNVPLKRFAKLEMDPAAAGTGGAAKKTLPVVAAPPSDPTVALVDALARLWAAIRVLHPGVPEVVILPAPAARERVLGHFSPLRWQRRGSVLHEVVVSAEYLSRHPREILGTVLREAAHALNAARGVKDASATSQYHNAHFRNAAAELGLDVEQVPNYGWAQTSCSAETARRYTAELQALTDALAHRRSAWSAAKKAPGAGAEGEDEGEGGEKKAGSRHVKATCGCGHIIRASRSVLATGHVRCAACGDNFR